MAKPPSTGAGGVLIALGAIVGAAIGFAMNEPTAGCLIGTATGIALALAIWLRSRG